MCFRSFSSIVCCMCGHQLPQVLAKVRCTWYSCRLICCFLAYRYLISSFILMLGSCVRQLIKPTLCIAHCISQRPELRVDRSARCLVFECTADRQHRFPPITFLCGPLTSYLSLQQVSQLHDDTRQFSCPHSDAFLSIQIVSSVCISQLKCTPRLSVHFYLMQTKPGVMQR
jgi:hypothetical protein